MSEFQDMSFAAYRAAPGANLSRLKMMADSPRKYFVNPGKETKSLAIGRAIHTAVLEPEKFASEFATFGARRAGKAYTEFCEAHKGKGILNDSELYTVNAVRDAVMSHKVAREYFTEGRPEVSIFWTHEPTGIQCKSRADWLRDDVLIDLKSARDVTMRGFGKAAAGYDYFAQLAFYLDAAKAVDGKDRKVVILAVETSSPFDVVPYVVPEYALQAGRAHYTDWLLKLAECERTDYWPGVSDVEVELHPPEWYLSEWDDATLTMPDGTEVAA